MKSLKYFSATWCGPCKVFKPVMQEIASQGSNVEFIDVDEQSDVAAEFGVRSVPTTVVMENGQEVDRFVGAIPKEQVLERIS
jgi:thioredoxin 1|tara:strand:+ start:287 stop:532 length:246 start_codon:yes stop_codon:yes gene_type:complete